MGQFKRSIVIKCTIDKAFDYIADWQNLKSFLSNILDISPVSFVHTGPGAAFDTTFKIGGANILTTLEVQEFIRNKRLIMRSRRGLKIVGGWELKEVTGGVNITFSIQFELPPGYIRSEYEKASIDKEFDAAAGQSLDLLRWVLESSTSQNSEQI